MGYPVSLSSGHITGASHVFASIGQVSSNGKQNLIVCKMLDQCHHRLSWLYLDLYWQISDSECISFTKFKCSRWLKIIEQNIKRNEIF